MGLLNINNGVSQEKGITYTVIIDDISNDFGDVSNNTYFLDKQTQLVYYKNSTGDLVSIYEQGGSDITGSAGNGLTYNTTTNQIDLGGDIGIDPDPTKNDLYFTPVSNGIYINYGLTPDGYASTFTSSGLVETYRIDTIRTHTWAGYENMIGPFNNGNHLPGNPAREGVFEKQGPNTYIKSYQNLTPSFDSNSEYVSGYTGDGVTHYISESLNSTYRTILDTHTGNVQPLTQSRSTHVLGNFTWEVSNEDTIDATIQRTSSAYLLRTTFGATIPNSDGTKTGLFFISSDNLNLTTGDNYGLTTVPNQVIIGNLSGSSLWIATGSDDTKYVEASTNKKGIRYTGFGETPAEEDTGIGADYSTLVNTSLVPKKYVDDAILNTNNIYNTDDSLTSNRIIDLDNNSLTFEKGTVEIKGTGITTDTTLAFYNGDITPKKNWEFLDNGTIQTEHNTSLFKVSKGFRVIHQGFATGTNPTTDDRFNNFWFEGTGSLNSTRFYIRSGDGTDITSGSSILYLQGGSISQSSITGDMNIQTPNLINMGETIVSRLSVGVGEARTSFDAKYSSDGTLSSDFDSRFDPWVFQSNYPSTVAFNLIGNDSNGVKIEFKNNSGTTKAHIKNNNVSGDLEISTTGDIILDDYTLINEKLELSSKDHGILLNRVDVSEMNSISASDNEIVYNTELESLYRYDDPSGSWIALASGYGMVGVVRDSDNGVPTFYSDLQSALDTCKTLDSYNTVTLYSNHTTTTGIIIDNTFEYKHLTINFNGFKIENNQSDDTHCLTIGGLIVGATTVLLDGSLIRENGTTGKCIQHDANIRNVRMSKMYIYNENYLTLGFAASTDGEYDFGGSIFETGPSATLNTLRGSYSMFKNFTAISNSSIGALFLSNGAKATNFTVINKSTGDGITTQSSCIASNFYAESNSGNAVGSGIFSNFVAKSVSGVAVNGPIEAHDFVATTGDNIAVNIGGENVSNFRAENNSSTHACVYMSNTEECVQVYAKNKGSGYAINVFRNQANRSFSYNRITAISEGGIAANLSSNPGFKILFSHCEFVSKWNDVGGHSVRISGNDTVLTNCSFRVNNIGANNITSDSSITTKVANSTFDGATTPINSNVTLSNTFTSDPYGNITL